jgi:phage terminase Nu1 subunit (DNA packaging protein)
MTDFLNMEVSADVLGACLGISATRVQQLSGEGVVIKVRHGLYALGLSVAGYVTYLKKQIPGPRARAGMSLAGDTGDHAPVKISDERTLLVQEQRRKLTIENMRELGELVPIAEVEVVFGDVITLLMSQLETLAPQAAREVVGLTTATDVEQVLKTSIDRFREELANNAFKVVENYKVSTDA